MFLTELDTRAISRGRAMLIAELLYRLPGGKDIIKVPVGFKTDFASVPRAMRWLITGQDDTRKPAVVHDYLYRRRIGARDWADWVFLVAMKDEGVSRWKRWTCYAAVRSFGWIVYGKG